MPSRARYRASLLPFQSPSRSRPRFPRWSRSIARADLFGGIYRRICHRGTPFRHGILWLPYRAAGAATNQPAPNYESASKLGTLPSLRAPGRGSPPRRRRTGRRTSARTRFAPKNFDRFLGVVRYFKEQLTRPCSWVGFRVIGQVCDNPSNHRRYRKFADQGRREVGRQPRGSVSGRASAPRGDGSRGPLVPRGFVPGSPGGVPWARASTAGRRRKDEFGGGRDA